MAYSVECAIAFIASAVLEFEVIMSKITPRKN